MTLRRFCAAGAIAAVVVVMAGCAPQQYVVLSDLLGTQPQAGITDPHEATDEVCEGLDGCVEGWASDEAEFSRFDSTDAAKDYAETLGRSGFRSNFLVIDWTSDIDPIHRQWVEELFEAAHQSE